MTADHRLILAAGFGAAALYLIQIGIGPQTVDDCILAHANGENAGAVVGACQRKFAKQAAPDFSGQTARP